MNLTTKKMNDGVIALKTRKCIDERVKTFPPKLKVKRTSGRTTVEDISSVTSRNEFDHELRHGLPLLTCNNQQSVAMLEK